eukprot:4222376-Pyramimonas_sp.AAC.1
MFSPTRVTPAVSLYGRLYIAKFGGYVLCFLWLVLRCVGPGLVGSSATTPPAGALESGRCAGSRGRSPPWV